jgi:hypothetical protein
MSNVGRITKESLGGGVLRSIFVMILFSRPMQQSWRVRVQKRLRSLVGKSTGVTKYYDERTEREVQDQGEESKDQQRQNLGRRTRPFLIQIIKNVNQAWKHQQTAKTSKCRPSIRLIEVWSCATVCELEDPRKRNFDLHDCTSSLVGDRW